MEVPLATTGLAPSVLAALLGAGFQSVGDVLELSARELAAEAKIDVKEAAAVIEELKQDDSKDPFGASALQVLQQTSAKRPISLFVGELDELLGGGLPRGELIEICGGPGAGKTQLAIHACLAAQCVRDGGEEESSAIFIDSEGSFMIERVAEMAAYFCEDFPQQGVTRDDLLRGISYYRVHDFVEQMEVVHSLPDILSEVKACKLIVMDTVAFHFRHGFDEYSQRIRALDDLAALLHAIAVEFQVCVLLVNHMTTKSGTAFGGDMANQTGVIETPALGESWSRSVTSRLVLGWESDFRVVRVVRSPSLAHGDAAFRVCDHGVRAEARWQARDN